MAARAWWAAALLLLLLSAAAATQVNDTTGVLSDTPGGSGGEAEGTTWETAPAGSEQDLLKWALAHSDPDELRRAAARARLDADAGSPDFQEKQERVQQLLEAMKTEPTEAELMQEAVAILSNSSATVEQLANALEALRWLVEPIDNANTLQGLGGLAPVVALLGRQHPPHLNAAAAYTLGTAASNNHQFLQQLLGDHPEALPLLLQLLGAGDGSSSGGSGAQDAGSSGSGVAAAEQAVAEAGVKALYCLSNILRLSDAARIAFYQAGGVQTLQVVLRSGGTSLRLKRKAISLLTDLIHLDAAAMGAAAAGQQQQQQAAAGGTPAAGLDYPAAVVAALQLLEVEQPVGQEAQQEQQAQQDYDLQEKALLVLLAMLENSGGSGSAGSGRMAAAELIAESGGLATLARLEASLTAAAVAEGDEEVDYLHEIAGLARRVQQHVRQRQPAEAGGEGGRGGALGSGMGHTAAGHDGTEL